MNAISLWALLSREELSAITMLLFVLLTVVLQDSDRTRSLGGPLLYIILTVLLGAENESYDDGAAADWQGRDRLLPPPE